MKRLTKVRKFEIFVHYFNYKGSKLVYKYMKFRRKKVIVCILDLVMWIRIHLGPWIRIPIADPDPEV